MAKRGLKAKRQAALPKAKKRKRPLRTRVSTRQAFDESRYEFDFSYRPAESVKDIRTIPDLVRFAEAKKVDLEAKVIVVTPDGRTKRTVNREAFVEAYRKPNPKLDRAVNTKSFRESAFDAFLTDQDESSGFGSNLVGEDFIPLLGGPFSKQMYYYDALKQHQVAFHAWNHDALAKRIIQIVKYFVLGKGFRTDVMGKDADKGLAVWRAFEEVNDLQTLAEYIVTELEIYGEVMSWELPDGQTKIGYDLRPGQEIPRALIPRYRLIDPSTVWEIVTFPEDITRVLFFWLVYPTQYQMTTGKYGGSEVPSQKFIMDQVPGDQILHYKINAVSNEKRGRSGLFPILGHLKRMRDAVNYRIIADQKNSAYCMDTTIEGSQTDVDRYKSEQDAMGPMPQAASEFIHTSAIKRTYLANEASGGHGHSSSFDWVLSLIAAGAGIPVSYFGTHLSGGQTRSSALVATEPVAKLFEDKQKIVARILTDISRRLFRRFKLDCELEVTFSEIITQDRSQKIKDISVAELSGYITHERAAVMVAKEIGVDEYEYEEEMKARDDDPRTKSEPVVAPLTSPASGGQSSVDNGAKQPKPSAVTSKDRKQVKRSDTQ